MFWGSKNWGGKTFWLEESNSIFFGYRLSKHKMTRYAAHFGEACRLPPPGNSHARIVIVNNLLMCSWVFEGLPLLTARTSWETATILSGYRDGHAARFKYILLVVVKRGSTVFWETVEKVWKFERLFRSLKEHGTCLLILGPICVFYGLASKWIESITTVKFLLEQLVKHSENLVVSWFGVS